MAIANLQQMLIRTLLVIGFISLAACGGGGSSKPKDKTPETFSFTASTNAEPGAVVTSAPVTITGIDAASPITITGGQYSVAGGAFTTAAGTISNNQTLSVRVTASLITNTEVQAVVTIGGVSGAFVVTTAPDVTPSNFILGSVTGVALSSVNTSEAITLSGIDVAVPISITGGEYAINGGSYTSIAGTIGSGQSVTVRVTAAATHSTAVESTLTIGGISATYAVTTISDTTPNAFSFPADTDVEPNSENISDAITVTGIDAATPISITNGEYSINSGAYTSVAGTVTLNQTVTVKVVAPNGTDLTQTAVLTIGGVTGDYVVTTFPDDEAPVAEFKFPTPYTMSEANSVKVRGTATDYSAITSVKVKVNNAEPFDVTPKAEGDYSSWTADIPLTENAENTVVILTEDEEGNSAENAAQVVIRQRTDYLPESFPDNLNLIDSIFNMSLDNFDGRNRLLVAQSRASIIAVDIETGEREIIQSPFNELLISFFGIAVDPINKKVFLSSVSDSSIIRFDLANPSSYTIMENDLYDNARALSFIILGETPYLVSSIVPNGNSALIETNLSTGDVYRKSDAALNIPDAVNPMVWIDDIDFDHTNNRYFAVDDENIIFSIDADTGARSIFNIQGENLELELGRFGHIAIDEEHQKAIVLHNFTGNILSVDLVTGEGEIIAATNLVGDVQQKILLAPTLDVDRNCIYFSHINLGAIIELDLETGQQLILSKSVH